MRNLPIVFAFTLLVIITACQPGGEAEEPSVLPAATPSDVVSFTDEDTVWYSSNGLTLSVNKPSKWESFPTEYGIVIGERFGSVATAGVLEGLMSYVFVTPLADFAMDTALEVNIAQIALDEILADPVYTSNIAHTETMGFRWGELDAAYYLISGEDNSATMVIGVAVPEQRALLSCSISAPYSQRDRIRKALPELLNGVKFNEITLNGAHLTGLPDPLEFPVYKRETKASGS